MMERYADLGVDAMETYIGAVKSLDQALRRMPAVQLDTAGLGRAISIPLDSTRGAFGAYQQGEGDSRWMRRGGSADAYEPGGAEPAWPRAGAEQRDGGYRDYRPEDRGYGPENRGYGPEYRDYDPEDAYGRGGYDDGYGPEPYGRSGGAAPRGDRPDEYTDGLPPYRDSRDGRPSDARGGSSRLDERAGPPPRGLLHPPGQRLARPWLEEDGRQGQRREAVPPRRGYPSDRVDRSAPRTGTGHPADSVPLRRDRQRPLN